MRESNPERGRSIELGEDEMYKVKRLPDFERRVAYDDYEFFSYTDIELRELEQEARWSGLVLAGKWDGQHFAYTIEQMSPEEHAAFGRGAGNTAGRPEMEVLGGID